MEVQETILKIEAHWLRIQPQLELLRKIWPSLDENYQIHQNTVIQVLQGKIMAATSVADSLIGDADDQLLPKGLIAKKGEIKRAKYAILVKDRLANILKDLKDWSEIFDISWFLMIRQSNKAIDKELKPVEVAHDPALLTLRKLRKAIDSTITAHPEEANATVFIESSIFGERSQNMQYSSMGLWCDANGTDSYVVDPPNETTSLASVCKLAKILKNVDPARFNILQCHGVLKIPTSYDHAENRKATRFVFSIPSHLTEPQSLRRMILVEMENKPLDERFLLARQLAKAVMFVHSAGFVHKDIRPENIILLRNRQKGVNAFLTGFKSFRLEEGHTLLRGDDLWESNLYRHPTRQGIHPEETYSMQHDIYSLGVCLLEVGMANSLLLYDDDNTPQPHSTIATAPLQEKDTRKRAFELKRTLVKLAKDTLPQKMGCRYSEAVITCLTCLDKTENAFGSETELLDENGLLVGVRFIEKVSI